MSATFNVVDTVHSAFTVSDLGRTLAMFRDFLGCEVVAEDAGGADVVETLTGIEDARCKLGFVRDQVSRLPVARVNSAQDLLLHALPRLCRLHVHMAPCSASMVLT